MPQADITMPIDLTGHSEGTGPKRHRQPVFTDFMPPCNSACPAGENIQAWMAHAQAGDYYQAFQQMLVDNPFPGIMGRICVKPCENGCNRNYLDTTVSIHAVERYIGDLAVEKNWQPRWEFNPTGKRIMVVGAGPGGLSAAYHLTRMGHGVEVFEASNAPGGLMRHGIPEYRLPRRILELEIGRIRAMGVMIHLNHPVHDLLTEKESGGFDAVFLSTGAQVIRPEAFNDEDGTVSIQDAFTFLRRFTQGEDTRLGRDVIVYGGGKLAMYIARIVKRWGAEVTILFPGDRNMMPAFDYEVDDALSEGIEIQFQHSIRRIKQQVLTLEKMKIDHNNAVGTGEWASLKADSIILAHAQQADTSYLQDVTGVVRQEDGTVVIDADRMTGHAGIFAGGDMLPGESRSATIAIGQGKKAARHIDAWINGETFTKPRKPDTVGHRKLHMWYRTQAPMQEQHRLVPWVAVRSFDEIIQGLSEQEARYEAKRCLSCGNCFECDGCFGACPEDAIVKLGPGKGYQFDLEKCTGCGVCYEQCPCHAIEMIPEPDKAPADAQR